MSKEADQFVADLGKWYFEHKGQIPKDNLAKRIDFLETAIMNLVNCLTFLVRDNQALEQRAKSPSLYLPKGMSLRGDLTKLG